ncbi:MAG: hypothetical protein PWP21_1476 [Thermosediminibacterales bacterium]|nr:hypothetical protein [Thermosediminibacterales bacterium]
MNKKTPLARASGKSLLGRFAAVAASGRQFYERYFTIYPEDILAECSENLTTLDLVFLQNIGWYMFFIQVGDKDKTASYH